MKTDDKHAWVTVFLLILILCGVELLKREVQRAGGWSSITLYFHR